MRTVKRVLSSIALGAFMPSAASACATCYGGANSGAVDGMNAAILAMLGVIGLVFAAIASFFIMARRRTALLNAAPVILESSSSISN